MRNIKSKLKGYMIGGLSILALLAGLFLLPKQGLAQGVSSGLPPEVSSSAGGSSAESTSSVSFVDESSVWEAPPPSSGEPEIPSSDPAISSETQPEPELLPGAEATIHVAEEQTLVLGEAGAFIFRTDGGNYEEIPAVEWEVPAGIYDAETKIVFDGGKGYLRSVVPAQIASISGPNTQVVIVGTSDINIASAADIAVDVNSLFVSIDGFALATRLEISAAKIGVRFLQKLEVGSGVSLRTTAGDYAILGMIDTETGQMPNVIFFKGSSADITATGPEGIALRSESIQISGAKVTARAPAGVGGVQILGYTTLQEVDGEGAVLDASSATGMAVSCRYVDSIGSKIRGVTPGGRAGLHVEQYMSAANSEIYGEAYSGFGIVVNNILENTEYPSGSLATSYSKIEGHVQEGMGISTNTLSAGGDPAGGSQGRILGTAQKGIGISVCSLNSYGSTYIEGLSFGATAQHYQVYNSIPNSVGISALSSMNVSGMGTVIGIAPKDVAGSFGIHCLLIYEGGYMSGYTSFGGSDMPLNVIASGETAIFSLNFVVNDQVTVNADAKVDGIVTSILNIQGYTDAPIINAKGEQGTGIKVVQFFDGSSTDVSIFRAKIVAIGGEYGFSAQVNSFGSLQNSSVVAQANGANAVAGFFLIRQENEGYGILELFVNSSHLEASSPQYGFLFMNVELRVSAMDFALQQPGHMKGEGGESGIKFEYSAEFESDYISGTRRALSASDMLMPNGEPYIIWGVSSSYAPDVVGREPAISLPSCEIAGGGILREEYLATAKETLTETRKHKVYAAGMNIENYEAYVWSCTTNSIQSSPQGLSAMGAGTFLAGITGERTAGVSDSDKIILTDGTHQTIILADINIATVVFHGEGGLPETEHHRVPMGVPFGQGPVFTKLGSEFVHWYDKSGAAVWSLDSQIIDKEHIELFAVWNALQYQLIFDANANGEPVQNMPSLVSLLMGNLLPKPAAVPQRVGAQFKHWSISPSGDAAWDFENGTMPANSMTLYAIWGAQNYTITYNANGGTPAIQSEIVAANSNIPGNINEPTRLNFVFTGWYENIEATTLWQPGGPMPNNNLTVYAGWSHEFIVFNFEAGGGDVASLPEPIKAQAGTEMHFIDYQSGGSKTPTYEGHIFLGWLDDSGNILQQTMTAPTNDVHLVAQWEKIELLQAPEDIVAYIGGKTQAEIENEMNISYTYTDLLHREHVLTAKPQWNTEVLVRGGVAQISLVFEEPNVSAILKAAAKIYVLRHPVITSQHSQTFSFGQEINMDGNEWGAECFTQHPDFKNGIITVSSLPLVFHLNGTNTRVAGAYEPSFTAIYVNHFGGIQNLTHGVEALVLTAGGGQSFDYWATVSAQMRSQTSARHMLVTALNYPLGGDPIMFAPNLFSKRVVAKPGSFTMMTADALASVTERGDAQLQVDLGWINWYMNSEDFDGKEHSGVYPLGVQQGTDQDKLREYAEKYNSMLLQFEMNKSWNGNPTMQVEVTSELAQSASQGETLYLFWFNTATQRLELIGDMNDNGGGKFSVRMKSVNQNYIILDKMPLDKNGKLDFDISDKTNPLSEELANEINELNKDDELGITEEPEIGIEKETPMISMLFPSQLCIVIIIILLIIIAILLYLYLRTRKKLKKLLRNNDFEDYEEDTNIVSSEYVEKEFEDYNKELLRDEYIPQITKEDLYDFDEESLNEQ